LRVQVQLLLPLCFYSAAKKGVCCLEALERIRKKAEKIEEKKIKKGLEI
jgi:hypothetical protein